MLIDILVISQAVKLIRETASDIIHPCYIRSQIVQYLEGINQLCSGSSVLKTVIQPLLTSVDMVQHL